MLNKCWIYQSGVHKRGCCFRYKSVNHQWGQDEIICQVSVDGKEEVRGWSPGALQYLAVRRKDEKPAKETEGAATGGRTKCQRFDQNLSESKLLFNTILRGRTGYYKSLPVDWLCQGQHRADVSHIPYLRYGEKDPRHGTT